MKVVVFDFDGVIIPSEGIKRQGYSWIFSEYGEAVPEQAIREAREEFSNAKGDRYDIVRGVLLRMGVGGDIEQKVTEYVERFNMVVNTKINSFQVDENVLQTLRKLSRRAHLYINSNTPDEPLRASLEKLGILPFFKGVYGSSLTKVESMRAIARIEMIPTSEFVFVGDGDGDHEAAEECGSIFVGVATSSNGWSSATKVFPVVSSVADITDAFLTRVI